VAIASKLSQASSADVKYVRPASLRLALLGAMTWLLIDAAAVGAHDLGVVRVRLVEVGSGHYVVEARVPPVPEFEALLPTLAPRCRMRDAPDVRRRETSIDMRLTFDCGGAVLTAADVLRLPWPNHGAFVSADFGSHATAGHFFEASEQGASVTLDRLISEDRRWIDVSRHYLLLGIEHILTGWDHLAFVLMLCLVASGWPLLYLVSAFTVGHSLTLALAALGFVHIPSAPTEACIALSIVFVAHEAIGRRDHRSRQGAALVFAFGLLHGLGFANALAASGIQRTEFFFGLVTFNLGVEIGQLMFVGVVVSISRIGRVLESRSRRLVAQATAYAVGVLGAFWTLQRTL
jgi:hypothetical protein